MQNASWFLLRSHGQEPKGTPEDTSSSPDGVRAAPARAGSGPTTCPAVQIGPFPNAQVDLNETHEKEQLPSPSSGTRRSLSHLGLLPGEQDFEGSG